MVHPYAALYQMALYAERLVLTLQRVGEGIGNDQKAASGDRQQNGRGRAQNGFHRKV